MSELQLELPYDHVICVHPARPVISAVRLEINLLSSILLHLSDKPWIGMKLIDSINIQVLGIQKRLKFVASTNYCMA